MDIWNSFLYTVNLEMISSPELDVLILRRNKIYLDRKIIYQKTHPSSLPRAKTVPSRFQDTSVRPNGLCCGYTSNNVKFRNSLLKSITMNVTHDMKLYTEFFLLQQSPTAIMREKFRTGNPAMSENLVMTSAYTVRTDFGSRGKKLSRVVKGVPDMYVFVIYFAIKKQSKCSRNNT